MQDKLNDTRTVAESQLEYSVAEAREHFADVINEVKYARHRAIIRKHGKDVVAVVSIEDLELLRRLEDIADLNAIREAMSEDDAPTDWDSFRQELLNGMTQDKGRNPDDVRAQDQKPRKKITHKTSFKPR